jgi:hypothetical protein
MQCLLLTGVAAATIANAIYLPYDKAPIPFGDPLAATLTAATPTVITVPGYVPTTGDAVSLSVAGTSGFLSSLAGLTSISLQLNTTYYVVGTSISGSAFSITTQKGGVNPATVQAMISTLTGAGGQVFVHLLSNQADGPTLPFKPTNTVLAWNAGNVGMLASNAAPITLFGANDVSSVLASGVSGQPLGPNGSATTGWNVIGTVGFGAPKLLQLSYDWIVASGSTCTLVLLQN